MKRFATLFATYLTCLFVAFWIVAFLILGFGKVLSISGIEKSEITQDIIKLGTASLATWVWVKWKKYDFSARNRFGRTSSVWLGLVVGGLSVVLSVVVLLPFGWLQAKSDMEPIWEALLLSLSGSIAAGVGEEIIFRGVLYTLFRDALPRWFSALIAAVLFAVSHLVLNHYDNPFLPPFYVTMGGLLFALAWELKGLWYAIGLHVGLDLATGKIELFTNSIAPSWIRLNGGVADWIPLFLLACVLLVQQRISGAKIQNSRIT